VARVPVDQHIANIEDDGVDRSVHGMLRHKKGRCPEAAA
jgi:hypothetical protein